MKKLLQKIIAEELQALLDEACAEHCKVLVINATGQRGDVHCGEEAKRLEELVASFPNMYSLDDPLPTDKKSKYAGPQKQIKLKIEA